jgi:hypothetical protein
MTHTTTKCSIHARAPENTAVEEESHTEENHQRTGARKSTRSRSKPVSRRESRRAESTRTRSSRLSAEAELSQHERTQAKRARRTRSVQSVKSVGRSVNVRSVGKSVKSGSRKARKRRGSVGEAVRFFSALEAERLEEEQRADVGMWCATPTGELKQVLVDHPPTLTHTPTPASASGEYDAYRREFRRYGLAPLSRREFVAASLDAVQPGDSLPEGLFD